MTGTPPRPFDLFSPLSDGCTLIEASAGTGKTTTIGRIFVRLVVEERLEAKKILVVTFTEAATQELRRRVRGLLRDALAAFTKGSSDDDFLAGLLSRNDAAAAARLLTAALRGFDEVSIFTIHGFCERVLRENAFESGQPFDVGLITDQSALVTEIAQDFWRRHFYTASPLFVSWALENDCDLKSLLSLFRAAAVTTRARVSPRAPLLDTASLENRYTSLVSLVRREWEKNSGDIVRLLGLPGLDARKYSRPFVENLLSVLELFFASNGMHLPLVLKLDKLTQSVVRKAVKKGHADVSHQFFALFEDLRDNAQACVRAWQQNRLHIKASFLDFMEKELVLRKKKCSVMYYDDLLLRVAGALDDTKRSGRLIGALRSSYRAALIDEFQDTDPVQYAIFSACFSKGTILFLIGDPKQAIFSFRGADIFAYIQAAKAADKRFTLTVNYRSDPGLIRAVNALFCRPTHPFVFEDIVYRRVDSPEKNTASALVIDGRKEVPFHLWFADQAEIKKKTGSGTKDDVQHAVGQAVASEAGRLIRLGSDGRAFIEKNNMREPVLASDIAVLVRTHREGLMMQAILSGWEIHSILDSDASVFESAEALAVERVLSAVAEPSRPGLMKAALTTCLFDHTAADILGLDTDEAAANLWALRFFDYHGLWRERGVMFMLRELLAKENVRQRLLSQAGGRRSLTNVLHIAELLHKQESSSNATMSGLVLWLVRKRAGAQKGREEEDQIRLESDDNSVRIVTIHKSKGLEYPIVFCPFAWQSSRRAKSAREPFVFHDPQAGDAATLVIGENEIDGLRHLHERETLAENLRLLYVGLTRAKVRCYFVWGILPTAETSAPAYLFHGADHSGAAVAALESRMKTMTMDAVRQECASAARDAQNCIHIQALPDVAGRMPPLTADEPPLACREFKSGIPATWKVASFTSLSHDSPVPDDAKHLFEFRPDFLSSPDSGEVEGFTDIAGFPRGAKAGIFFHDLLEHIDFRDTASGATAALVTDKLLQYGFDTAWGGAVLATLANVAGVPLVKDITLSGIAPGNCLREMDFYFPLKMLGPQDLEGLFSNGAPCGASATMPIEERSPRLQFSPLRGFMKGCIDLVFEEKGRFYLVDWKSNYCGGGKENYSQDSLENVMTTERYVLQYHLYLAALHTYLSLRLPGYDYDRHFGSVFYVFLRGVNASLNPDFGIFRRRPEKRFVKQLCERLIDRED
jgi:exodeoxyribonuclease V beta subunit